MRNSLMILFLCLFSNAVFAESITLKSGHTIEGKIIEKTDKYIKVDSSGAEVTYFLDEIQSISGLPITMTEEKSTSTAIENFAGQAMDKIKNGDFDKLFDDFYIPKEYTPKDIESDREDLVASLKELIQNQVGLPENFLKASSVSDKLIPIDLTTGQAQEMALVSSTVFNYKVTFAKSGDGYVMVGVHQEGNKLSIKNITIGLLEKNPESMKIAQDFMNSMMSKVAGHVKKDQKDSQQVNSENAGKVQDAMSHVKQGGLYARQGNFEQALAEENKAIGLDPNNADAYFYRAAVYIAQKDFENVIPDENKAIELNPNYVDAYVNRGIVYGMKGDFNQAVDDFSKAIEIDPSRVNAYTNRARAYAQNKDYDKSWADVHKIESLGGSMNPQFLDALKKFSGREN